MKQYVLFEKDHLAIVRELFEQAPDFGPGDKAYVADGGAQEIIIDSIVEECGVMLYNCHSDSDFPINYYLTREEIFSKHNKKQCLESWEKMEENFCKLSPKHMGIEKCVAFNVCLVRPWQGRRVGKVIFSILQNGMVYVEEFGGYAFAYQSDTPYEDHEKLLDAFNLWKENHKGMYLEESATDHQDLYLFNGKYMSWNSIRVNADLREIRTTARAM